ncbi:conserved protein of unknown function [Tenacibaculum sp. 190130A14a]|uniref:Uncharacterized protein n=1 Tax=Tenacibaculum polynesiense TaxID=3137857 RepID=A0ABM9PAL9_9FLAO
MAISSLEKSIEYLYEVFSPYKVSGNLRERSCECCVTNEDITRLLSKSLHELEVNDINKFTSKAVTTFGDEQDYKHFLPRILELVAISEDSLIDDFLTFEKLNYLEWETWNNKEIIAVDLFFYYQFENSLKNENVSIEYFNSSLELICKYKSIDTVIKIWEYNFSILSVKFIVNYVLLGSMIDLSQHQKEILEEWFHSEYILNQLSKQFFKEHFNEEFKERISIVYTILENNNKLNS